MLVDDIDKNIEAFRDAEKAIIDRINLDEAMLNTSHVCARYGVSRITIQTWIRTGHGDFPKPMRMARRNWWKLGVLRAWESRLAIQESPPALRSPLHDPAPTVPTGGEYVRPAWAMPREKEKVA